MSASYRISRAAFPAPMRRDLLRRLHAEIARCGLGAADMADWRREACWFPALRSEPEVEAFWRRAEAWQRVGLQRCEAQILVAWPDRDGETEPPCHVDEPPPWANGRGYASILGIALTDWRTDNGAPCFHDAAGAHQVELWEGDAILMEPSSPHHSGLNRSGLPRFALYLRHLEP